MGTSAVDRILVEVAFLRLCIGLFSGGSFPFLILWLGSVVKAAARPPHSICDCGRINSFRPFVPGRGAASTEKFLRADCGCHRAGKFACAGRKWAPWRSLA